MKKYTIFFRASSPPLAYGVLVLVDSLEDMFPHVPEFVEGVLLPFEDRIIYDGYLSSYNLIFGGGMRRMTNNTYTEAKAKYGIMTSMPFEASRNEAVDAGKLKFHLMSERNKDHYWEEIQELIQDGGS